MSSTTQLDIGRKKTVQIDFYEVIVGKNNPLHLFYEHGTGEYDSKTMGVFTEKVNSIFLFVPHFNLDPYRYQSPKQAEEELIRVLIHENLHKALEPILSELVDQEEDEEECKRLHETAVNLLLGYNDWDDICYVCGRLLHDSRCRHCGFCRGDEEEIEEEIDNYNAEKRKKRRPQKT